MRRTPLAPSLAWLLVAGGCATAPHVVPAEGQAQAVASAAGVTLTVTSQEWEGSPDDLDEYITVVPVELYNAGPSEVRVSYYDFVLLDEAGFRYQAVNPFVPAQASREGAPADRMAGLVYPEEVSPPSVLVAGRGGGGGGRGGGGGGRGGSVRSGGGFGGARVGYGGVRSGGFGRGVRVGGVGWAQPRGVVVRGGLSPRGSIYMGWRAGFGGGWNGYRVYPHYRPWLGAGYGLWWDSPFFWPPGYAAWVLGWGPGWYPASPTVPQDVVNLGLPEGVLEAGGHVAGYLYFQRTHPEAYHLGLSWEIHEAREGTPLGNAQVQLDVVR